jgi:D-alanyl-D-alanine carboxypeptidase/D-alanyl-D-alanine-endopeptidase (penicillin-binding protein 4)
MRKTGKHMRCWRIIIFLIIYSINCTTQAKTPVHFHYAPTIYGKQNLITELNHIIQMTDQNADIGVQIKSMRSGDLLYTKNAKNLFVPASIMKIFTAEAALLYLGPGYTFPTRLLTDAKNINQGVIDGNVYLVHSGDPSLTYTDLNNLLVTLQAQNIREITGNVYIDNTAYDQSNFGPGWLWRDKQYCYAAPINASIINHNCLSFKIAPAKVSGHRANFVANSKYYYSGITNSVMTARAKSRSCYIKMNTTANNGISISGCMPKNHYAWGASTVIGDIIGYNKSLLGWLFRRLGIQVKGDIIAGSAPPGLSLLALHESKPLYLLIKEMLKKSDNIIAGSLFKKMGELYSKTPGSWLNGSAAVKKILAQAADISSYPTTVLDGSGLSPDNRIKPEQMIQVLNFAYHHSLTNHQFISALPIAGIDGTLKHRLYNVAGKVRAKTGTISGVVSLAGYALSKDKESLAFVIMVNRRHGNIWKYRKMEDEIVTALANYKLEFAPSFTR